MVGGETLSQPARGKDSPNNDPITTKTQLQPESPHKWHKRAIPRASSSGDQGDYTTESHSSPTIEVHTTKTGSQSTSI